MTDLCLSCIYRQETYRSGLSCALGRYHDVTGWDDPVAEQRPHYPHARDVSHAADLAKVKLRTPEDYA